MLLEKIIIEGIMPERALSKLQREGICVYHAKKLKKNQILLSVKKKDTEKVFAICPNVCYNMSEEDVSAAQSGPAERFLRNIQTHPKSVSLFPHTLRILPKKRAPRDCLPCSIGAKGASASFSGARCSSPRRSRQIISFSRSR